MRLKFLIIIFLSIIVTPAYTQPDKSIGPIFKDTQTAFTDKEILDAVYAGYRWPPHFYQEDLGKGRPYYATAISAKLPAETGKENIKLCTDNKNQAQEWVEAFLKNNKYYDSLIDERETEKFFEFTMGNLKNTSYTLPSRIHHCNYFISKYTRLSPEMLRKGDVIGIFGRRPITKENVKELIEYLWFIESHNRVLTSFAEDQKDSIKHTLYEVSVAGSYNYDHITLYKSEYFVSKHSGEVTLFQKSVKFLHGRKSYKANERGDYYPK